MIFTVAPEVYALQAPGGEELRAMALGFVQIYIYIIHEIHEIQATFRVHFN